jgi:hypothetical protein
MVYLSVTSLCLLFPICICLQELPLEKMILVMLLLANIILSILFWSNPIEHCFIHQMDAFFARISFFTFSGYILFKEMDITLKLCFLSLLVLSSVLFYYSDHYSKKEWCGEDHLLYHSMFHGVTSIGCSFAFI